MILLSLLIALALSAASAGQRPAPSMPPSHGNCKFDAPAFWGVGIDGLVTAASVKKEVTFEFSPAPGVADFDGVIFDARINEKGKVTSACVLRSVRTDVDAAALAALEQWTFRPARFKAPPHSAVPIVQTVLVKVRRLERGMRTRGWKRTDGGRVAVSITLAPRQSLLDHLRKRGSG